MKFGVSAPGSSTHMLLLSWAAKGGLKASDVVAIGVGAGATVVAAIEKGRSTACPRPIRRSPCCRTRA